jgi:hypothetical protein
MKVKTNLLMLSKIKVNKAKIHLPFRILKKNLKKDHYTGGQDLQFLLQSTEWRCCPTPSTCQAEGLFGLGWPDWAIILGGLH